MNAAIDERRRWRAEIKHHREAIRRLKVIRPERMPGHDTLKRLHIDFQIGERQAIIRGFQELLKGTT